MFSPCSRRDEPFWTFCYQSRNLSPKRRRPHFALVSSFSRSRNPSRILRPRRRRLIRFFCSLPGAFSSFYLSRVHNQNPIRVSFCRYQSPNRCIQIRTFSLSFVGAEFLPIDGSERVPFVFGRLRALSNLRRAWKMAGPMKRTELIS